MRDAVPSRTAEIVCLCRATEQRHAKEDRILDDPLAVGFLSPPLRAALAAGTLLHRVIPSARAPGLVPFVLARHRFIDDALLAALPRVTQVLVLGAGYDTRAWRFAEALGERPVFEVDHPATGARKRSRLDAIGLDPRRVTRVAVDFQRERLDARLLEQGFVPGRPTFVVWEGVSMYLDGHAVRGTLDTLATLCGPASELAMDFWYAVRPSGVGAVALNLGSYLPGIVGEPVTFGLHPRDAASFLAPHGWTLAELATASTLEPRYVRDGRRVLPSLYVVRCLRG